jgi:chromosome segregation ATPase
MGHLIRRALFVTLSLASMVSSDSASAQTARKDGGNNAQLMQQMQQLAAERTQLSAENARLKRELDETRKERDTLKGERESNDKKLRSVEGAAARASGDRKQVEDELAQNKERMGELVTKFRETVQTLREVETDRATTKQQLDTRNVDLKSCVDRNAQLYTINDEILKRLDAQGFWTGVAKAEPFTRIKRTQLENLADDYRARAEEARVAAPASLVAPTVPDHP